jgi:putative inorganic carbon (HCO3(-)) transporter
VKQWRDVRYKTGFIFILPADSTPTWKIVMLDRRLLLGTVPLTLFVALFAVSAYLGSRISYDTALIGDALNAILLSVLLYAITAYVFAARRAADFLSGLLLVIGAGFALLFISQFRYQDYPETPTFILNLGNASSILPNLNLGTLHPNAAATFLEAIIPLGLAIVIGGRPVVVRILSVLLTLVMLYAFFLTYSRGAYVGLFAAVLTFFAALVLSRLPRGVAIGIVVVLLVGVVGGLIAVFTLNPENLPSFVASAYDTAGSRLTLYRNSLYLARDYAFTGVGLGETFAMTYSRYSLLIRVPFLTYSHSLPLSVWLNQGLLGLVALLGIVGSFYLYVASVIRASSPPTAFHGAWLGVTATLVHGLTDARQYTESPWVMPLLFVVMGLTVAYGQVSMRDEGTVPEVNPRRWLAYAAVAAAVIAGAFFLMRGTFTAAWYTNQGALLETQGELAPGLTDDQRSALYNEAQNQYREALQSDRNYSPAARRLGNLLVKRGNYADAVPLLEGAYPAEITNPAALKGLGLAYVWVGQTEDAARLFALMPPDAQMETELATWGTYRRDELDEPLLAAYAWETLQLIVSEPNPNVWATVGDLYREANATDRARAAYQQALDADPSNEKARDGLEALNL